MACWTFYRASLRYLRGLKPAPQHTIQVEATVCEIKAIRLQSVDAGPLQFAAVAPNSQTRRSAAALETRRPGGPAVERPPMLCLSWEPASRTRYGREPRESEVNASVLHRTAHLYLRLEFFIPVSFGTSEGSLMPTNVFAGSFGRNW